MKISPLTEQVLRASQPNPTDFPDRWKVEGLRMVDGDAEEFEIELRGTAFDIGLDMDEATARSIAALPKLLKLVEELATASVGLSGRPQVSSLIGRAEHLTREISGQ